MLPARDATCISRCRPTYKAGAWGDGVAVGIVFAAAAVPHAPPLLVVPQEAAYLASRCAHARNFVMSSEIFNNSWHACVAGMGATTCVLLCHASPVCYSSSSAPLGGPAPRRPRHLASRAKTPGPAAGCGQSHTIYKSGPVLVDLTVLTRLQDAFTPKPPFCCCPTCGPAAAVWESRPQRSHPRTSTALSRCPPAGRLAPAAQRPSQ